MSLDAVGRALYRAILRCAKTFDANPVLKVLIHRDPQKPLNADLSKVVATFLGSEERNYYLPPQLLPLSVVEAVRTAFRFPESETSGTDSAFAVLRYCNALLGVARRHGLYSVTTPGVPTEPRLEDTKRPTAPQGSILSVPQKGSLLLAHPLLKGWFRRSAVLICNFTVGCYGLCLNKHLPVPVANLRRGAAAGDDGRGGPEAARQLYPLLEIIAGNPLSIVFNQDEDGNVEVGEVRVLEKQADHEASGPEQAPHEAADKESSDAWSGDGDDDGGDNDGSLTRADGGPQLEGLPSNGRPRPASTVFAVSDDEEEASSSDGSDEDGNVKRVTRAFLSSLQQTAAAKSGQRPTFTSLETMVDFHHGGPVPGLQVLHRAAPLLGGEEIWAPRVGGGTSERGIYLGADLDAAASAMRAGKLEASDLAFFVGEANWEPDQLEQELRTGFWMLVDSPAAATFFDAQLDVEQQDIRPGVTNVDQLWGNVLTGLGGEWAAMAKIGTDVADDIAALEFD